MSVNSHNRDALAAFRAIGESENLITEKTRIRVTGSGLTISAEKSGPAQGTLFAESILEFPQRLPFLA